MKIKVKNVMTMCLSSQKIAVIESDTVSVDKERLFEGENGFFYKNAISLGLWNRIVHSFSATDDVLYVFVEKETEKGGE